MSRRPEPDTRAPEFAAPASYPQVLVFSWRLKDVELIDADGMIGIGRFGGGVGKVHDEDDSGEN
jgi:hypothetical protein